MSKTNQDWYKTMNKTGIGRELSLQEGQAGESKFEDDLEAWQRKTCRAKWCLKGKESESAENE